MQYEILYKKSLIHYIVIYLFEFAKYAKNKNFNIFLYAPIVFNHY